MGKGSKSDKNAMGKDFAFFLAYDSLEAKSLFFSIFMGKEFYSSFKAKSL